ncbi:MAG: c-type cytochrome [Nitrosomonadales bacterium]|nr:c-type cytochrome [Nitrosomonadales bacterium]
MRKSKFTLSLRLVLAAAALQLGTAYAGNDVSVNIANGQKIFNEGKGDASACMGCHGEQGLGNDGMGAPRLANIGTAYIIKQLNDLANDRRVPAGMGAVMPGFAKALTEQDRHDVAVFLNTKDYEVELSDLKSLDDPANPVGKPELGKSIVLQGVKGKVPACQDCHGFNGRADRFPQINQQKYVYLVNQLNNWRDNSRANDPEVEKVGIMRGIAKKLSDADIKNIAAYLSTAPRVSPDGDPK